MKFRWDKKYLYWGITAFLVIVLSISFFLMLNRFDEFAKGLRFIGDLLLPFVIGLVVAYLLNPIMDFFERRCFGRLGQSSPSSKTTKLPRVLAIVVTFFLALAVAAGLILMVLPELGESIYNVAMELPSNFAKFAEWMTDLVSNNPELESLFREQLESIRASVSAWVSTNLIPQVTSLMSGLTTGLVNVVGVVLDIFVGLIVAIYVLFSKEKFIAQTKKLVYALLPVHTGNTSLRITRQADHVFGRFIKGKLIDSSIIGVLCFLGMTVFQMPYALLISVLIGITNIIPFFGPFIGAIPSAVLILMIDPWKCLGFILFILVLQQVDGNIIGPRILGDSTGLSAFWIIFSIMIFGGLFGFVGMIIGVPAFALIYSLMADFCKGRLSRHELPVNTSSYDNLEQISEDEHEAVYAKPTAPPPPKKFRKKRKS